MDVTVIVPVYNAQATILGTLRSIAAQTKSPAQVIAVDDASADRSVELIREFDPAIKIVSMPKNRGVAKARNTGARHASTEWIAFVDADDLWAPTFLEDVSHAIATTHVDFGSGGGAREKLDGTIAPRLFNEPFEVADQTSQFWDLAWSFMPCHPSSTIIRRSLFIQVGGFVESLKSGEDWPLWARLWLHGRFTFVNKALFRWMQLPTGLSAAGRSYRHELVHLGTIGGVLVRAVVMRRPGSLAFLRWYLRLIVRRHAFLVTRRLHGGQAAGSRD